MFFSNAILQYLADKYAKGSSIYPEEPKERALVNHRLCFDLGSYYSTVVAYAVISFFFTFVLKH